MLPRSGLSPDPWAVPCSGSLYSSPSSTPTCRHLPMSRCIDPSATRSDIISLSLFLSKLSKKATMSASSDGHHASLVDYLVEPSHRIMSPALRPESVRVLTKDGLVHQLQYLAQRLLHDLVF